MLVTVIVACSGTASPTSTDELEPDQPANGVDAVIDWEDPAKLAEIDGGWTFHACDGDAPLLCVERNGSPVGGVEAKAYPVSSFDDLDSTADAKINLRRFADGFVEGISTDRAAGCGADYDFETITVPDTKPRPECGDRNQGSSTEPANGDLTPRPKRPTVLKPN